MHCIGPHQNYLPCPWGMEVMLCWLFLVRAVIRKVSFLCDLSVFGIDVQIFNKAGGCSEFRAELSAGGPDGTHAAAFSVGRDPRRACQLSPFPSSFQAGCAMERSSQGRFWYALPRRLVGKQQGGFCHLLSVFRCLQVVSQEIWVGAEQLQKKKLQEQHWCQCWDRDNRSVYMQLFTAHTEIL